MSLVIDGEERITAPIERVWEALNEPGILQSSIPGCTELIKTSDDSMRATVVLAIGPIKAKFNGSVTLSNIQPPTSYTISGAGQGGVAGFAKGSADVSLTAETPDITLLKYEAKAEVGGKIAQLGSRLIVSTSKRLAGDFFSNLNKTVSAGP
jgi:uncharacterized protein